MTELGSIIHRHMNPVHVQLERSRVVYPLLQVQIVAPAVE